MGIDWEEILGEDLPLDEAYDRALFGDGWEEPQDPFLLADYRLFGCPPPEDDGRDDWAGPYEEPDDEPLLCDGNYPFCQQDCQACKYCGSCGVAQEVDCPGDCYTCPYGPEGGWLPE